MSRVLSYISVEDRLTFVIFLQPPEALGNFRIGNNRRPVAYVTDFGIDFEYNS